MRYNRKLFRFNSQRARKRLIDKADGVYLDVYNGRLLNSPKEFDAEHIFPLKSAWEQGFNKQHQINPEFALENMKKFSNDERNLTIAGSSSNRSRGHKTLWNWSPLNLAWLPERNRIVRELAEDYGLVLTKPQQWAMDWSDEKITVKYKHGIALGKTRSWLVSHGFHKFLMPFPLF